jgi:FkbM family methyltransferase
MFGYQPSARRRLIRIIARVLKGLLRLHGRSIWSNEVIQALDPIAETKFGGETLRFRTGNGRLLWGVQTFSSEEPLMMRWIASMQSKDVVLDVGANAGRYSVAMARVVNRVYACELDPLNVGLIKENAFLNGVHDKVVILPFACGEKDDVVDVHFRDLSAGDALQSLGRPQQLQTRLGRHHHQSPIVVLSLDEFWKRMGLGRPTKIKIDVDGNEATVYKGIRSLCSTAREIYFEDSQTPECAGVIIDLKALGFVEVEQDAICVSSSSPGARGSPALNRLFRKYDS